MHPLPISLSYMCTWTWRYYYRIPGGPRTAAPIHLLRRRYESSWYYRRVPATVLVHTCSQERLLLRSSSYKLHTNYSENNTWNCERILHLCYFESYSYPLISRTIYRDIQDTPFCSQSDCCRANVTAPSLKSMFESCCDSQSLPISPKDLQHHLTLHPVVCGNKQSSFQVQMVTHVFKHSLSKIIE